MRLFASLEDARGHVDGLSCCIGNFDGVHRGHQALLARADGVLTFTPHPAKVFAPDRAPKMILTQAEKRQALQSRGARFLIEQPFGVEFARTAPEDFAQTLVDLKLAKVVVGTDFSYGHKGRGRVSDLKRVLDVETVTAVRAPDGQVCSSSAIRAAVAAGDVERAAVMLGRPYSITGEVVHGDGRGAGLGFPTANIDQQRELLPAFGVYVGEVSSLGRAVVNIGERPTFGRSKVQVEAHLLAFDGDLYGRELSLSLWARLRPEERFESVDALRAQVRSDIAQARDYTQETPGFPD